MGRGLVFARAAFENCQGDRRDCNGTDGQSNRDTYRRVRAVDSREQRQTYRRGIGEANGQRQGRTL
jgi:hypothetical protein